VHGAELIRMQCYEGLDANSALYDWNYQRQLIAIKAQCVSQTDASHELGSVAALQRLNSRLDLAILAARDWDGAGDR
jgi:MoxR-like ATPase